MEYWFSKTSCYIHFRSFLASNRPVSLLVNLSLKQSARPYFRQSVSRSSDGQSVSQSVSLAVLQSVNESVSQWVSQWVSASVSQWVSQWVSESVSQSVSQWVSQSVSPSARQSVTQVYPVAIILLLFPLIISIVVCALPDNCRLTKVFLGMDHMNSTTWTKITRKKRRKQTQSKKLRDTWENTTLIFSL